LKIDLDVLLFHAGHTQEIVSRSCTSRTDSHL
jgi:hypothetical protein